MEATFDWKSIAAAVAGSAPALGTALGAGFGPIGATIGGIAGKYIADAFGVEATPEAVGKAIAEDPEAGDKLKTLQDTKLQEIISAQQTEIARINAEASTTLAVNETIRAENAARASTPQGWWGNWRLLMAWTLAGETCLWPPFIMYCIVVSPAAVASLITLSSLLIVWWGARFGVLGVHVWTGSNERQAIIQAPSSPVGNTIKAIETVARGKK